MAAIVWADVTNLVASLSTVPGGAQTEILAQVNAAVNAAKLGGEDAKKTKLARIYLAAHMGELERLAATDPTGQAGGAVSSKRLTADGFQVDYSQLDTSAESLQTTTHGRAYLSLIRRSACGVGFNVR